MDEQGNFFLTQDRIPSHTCTRRELGLEGYGNDTFSEVRESSASYLEQYHKKFICIDPEEMYIYGDFDASSARLIQI